MENEIFAEPAEELMLNTSNKLQNINHTQYSSGESLIIHKNVIIIGLAFMIHFTAFMGTTNLQSSVNANEALGTITLACIYISLII